MSVMVVLALATRNLYHRRWTSVRKVARGQQLRLRFLAGAHRPWHVPREDSHRSLAVSHPSLLFSPMGETIWKIED